MNKKGKDVPEHAEYVLQTLNGKITGIALKAPGVEGYIVGRADEASDYMPDVDLSAFEARERGVSRRHAALVQFKGDLHVVDLGSINGTFINGKRLTPETPFPISPGDEMRLGTLDLILLRT